MDHQSIKKSTFLGVFWKFFERILAQGVSLVVSVVLARLLTPEDFSSVSIVAIFFTFSNVIISGGLNTALIQKKDADPEDYSAVMFSSLLCSILIYFLLFFAAPTIAKVYKQKILISVIRVMGIILPINAIKSVWCAYISSTLQFRKFFFATLGGTLFSALVGIILALRGLGPWALVAQQMSNTLIDTIILMATTRFKIALHFSYNKFRILFSYGWKVLASNLLSTTYAEVSPLVIGIKFSPIDLSYYSKGKVFPSAISTSTTSTLSAVLFPVLSKYQDNKERVLGYTRLYMRLSSFVVFPLMLGLLAVSDTFVTVLLTEKWLNSSYYIQIFCLSTMFDMVAIGNCETIKALGRSDIYLKIEVIKKTLYFVILVCFIAFSNSPRILALSALACTAVQLIVNSAPNNKLISYKYIDQISDIIPSLFISIVMCIAVIFLGKTIKMNLTLLLFVQIVFGAIMYILLAIITKNSAFNYLWKTGKKVLTRIGN